MIELMKEWKGLYEAKGIEDGYTIYTNGFGHYGPVIVIHTWAKSEAGQFHARYSSFNLK